MLAFRQIELNLRALWFLEPSFYDTRLDALDNYAEPRIHGC